jgi:hypothetical protein
MFRTDSHNNPTAFTVDIAREGGLVLGRDYTQGDPFTVGSQTFYTARLLGDPVKLTIGVIDKIGFRVGSDPFKPRWTYINIPYDIWQQLSTAQKTQVIGDMYKAEGGTAMLPLFAKPQV